MVSAAARSASDAIGAAALARVADPPRSNSVRVEDYLAAELAQVPTDSVVGILIAELVPGVVQLADFGSVEDLYRSVAANVGKTAWGEVHLTVGDDHLPTIPPIRLAFELRRTVEEACMAAGVAPPQRYQACALALAAGLDQVREAIDIKVGLRLALEVVFGMAKMPPMSRRAFAAANVGNSVATI